MLSTSQILQFVLLTVTFAAAILFFAGGSRFIKGIASRPLFLISALSLFFVFVLTEAIFSVYYLKFISGYGVYAALLSACAVIILILPFSGYTVRAISVIRSVPFKITMPVRKTVVITKRSELQQSQKTESDNLPGVITSQNIEQVSKPESEIPEPVITEEEASVKEETTLESKETDVDPVISGKSESVKTADTQVNIETGKGTTGNQTAKRKPRQKSAAKKPQGSQTQQKNTSGKTRGRRKK